MNAALKKEPLGDLFRGALTVHSTRCAVTRSKATQISLGARVGNCTIKERALWPSIWSKKAAASVIVDEAQGVLQEESAFKHGFNIYRTAGIAKESQMAKEFEEFQKAGEQFQKVGKDSFDAAVRSLGEVNKGLQAIAAEVTDYSKKAVEDNMRAFEQLMSAKSLDQAIEIQSQYTKKAYDTYMAEMSKLGEMYVGLARNVYKPVESALPKKTV